MGLNDLSGSWLERFRTYCEKVAGLDLKLGKNLWDDTRRIVEVRNCLIHAEGDLNIFQKSSIIRDFARRHEIPIIEENILICDYELANLTLKIVGEFIEIIYNAALFRYPYPSSQQT